MANSEQKNNGSFVFYKSFYDSLADQEQEFRDRAVSQIIDYGLFGIEPDLSDPLLKILWANWKPLMDADMKRRKGGAPRGNQNAKGHKGAGGRPKKKTTKKLQPSDVDVDVDVEGDVDVYVDKGSSSPLSNDREPQSQKQGQTGEEEEQFDLDADFAEWEKRMKGQKDGTV